MASAEHTPDEPQFRSKMRRDLQEMLADVGLSVEYWLPKLQEQLDVTCTQALQYLKEKDLQKLKSHVLHPWEKGALERLIELCQSNNDPELQDFSVDTIKKMQKTDKALEDLTGLQSGEKQGQEEALNRKKTENRQVMEIPEENLPQLEKPLSKVTETKQKLLGLTEQTLSHRDLIKQASGGLALQGIYQTSQSSDLIQRREKILKVPKEFSVFGQEQSTRTESKEFTSSHAESIFTQTVETLGFSATSSVEGGGWGLSLEGGVNPSKHSESTDTHQSHSEHSYFCSSKFNYVSLATCHFPIDQLQLSKAALQELKSIEELLGQTTLPDRVPSLKHRTENFFHRFGSHANQGPVHLGGVYCWKAISEGFKREQLAEVKQQTAEALDNYIKCNYRGFGVKVGASMKVSDTKSKKVSQNTASQNLQTKVQLSVVQTGEPLKAKGFHEWESGLVDSNQTWSVIDRGLHLVPIWDIILWNHRSDFKDPLMVANCLKDNYTILTGLPAQIQDGEELLSAGKEARLFLQDVKSWEVSYPEEQLQKLINFIQTMSQKTKTYDLWINTCLTECDLQNFLINTVKFCKQSSVYKTHFIKSQLHSLLSPHVHKVKNFPFAWSIMKWIKESDSEEEQISITQFSEFIKALQQFKNTGMEESVTNESLKAMKEAQRKAIYEVTVVLNSFLNYLQETEKHNEQLLLLSFAVGTGYQSVYNIFQKLLGCDELNFLLDEMQTAEELNFLLDEMQTAEKKYKELNDISKQRAQAFLVLTTLTATAGARASSPEEKTRYLALVRQHMREMFCAEVEQVLTEHGSDHDWESLESDLRLLVDGNYKDTRSSLQTDDGKKQLQSLLNKNEESYRSKENEKKSKEEIENGPFLDILQRLDLECYYPKQMSRANFHLIYKTSVYNTQPKSEQELPFYFLQKLLMLDCGLRYLFFKQEDKVKIQTPTVLANLENEDVDLYEGLFEDTDNINPSTTESQPPIHPMDLQMAILHCADDFARQYILAKLSVCQFALPLVVPNPNSSQIEFSLWSLRQIRKSWQDTSKSPEEKIKSRKDQQMCSVSTPIVSFIRVGNGLSASKSQIMNSLLSKRKHDVFFHRHCRGSSKHCLLMGGVVEICWFCPGGEEEDRFDQCVAFTNLHGDAKEHKQQLTFLQEVSSLTVILMSTSDDSKESRKIVRDLLQSSKPLICLLDNKEKMIANNTGRKLKIGIRNRNEAELTEEITTAIKNLLSCSDTILSLEACSQIARKQGFLIDEDQRDCKEAKENAQTIIALLEESKLSEIKENFLPLQGHLWHMWCKKDKELYHLREKGNQSIEQHKSEIETDKRKIRRQQLEIALPLNDVMRSVLTILQENTETLNKLYFLQWLTLFIENLATEHLEELREKQRSLWSKVQAEKQKKQKSNLLTGWQNQIDAISTEISDYSFGIEQLLREFGQIYEALEETSSTRDSLFLCLPQIAADLMISGIPIELMDGDASYVPLKWVAAVFDKITEKLGDKRLFVLSILGLQSSGKSTLLNALFGLQFTVSAGRCTRGAYMQLLKVEEAFTKEFGFDFVLVVDTEGLRAPELNNKSQNWDNELATFVIGLAHLTLINIFGENPSEMQDILQIVVQAFLRMKQVKISPSCIFVHQNVGEVTAKDQTMEGLQRLEQRLDEMTVRAVEQEECINVTRFSDVIKFDVNNHVYYFAHLWDGNSPMAPPNPCYSRNVQELKTKILLTAQQESRRSIMKISDVKFRVQDLWNALVSENFIFNFKNTQEFMAMSKLETMYNHWTWKLRSHILDLQNQLNNQIQNGKILIVTTGMLEYPVNKNYETIKEEFEKYFLEYPETEILIQWKANFEHKLLTLKEALITETRRKTSELISLRKSHEVFDNQKKHYENEFLEKSQKMALSMKGKELSDENLLQKFNELWTNWVSEVSSAVSPVIEPDIDLDSENILLLYFRRERNLFKKIMRNSEGKFEINYDKHIQMKKNFFRVQKSIETDHKESIKMNTNNIFSRFEEMIKNIRLQQRDYNKNDFHEILKIIHKEVKSVPPEEEYTFTINYSIDLSVCLFQRASKSFKEMHKALKRANDPVNYLESKKDDFFMSFKISCQGATSITSFVNFLWLKLIPAISATIWEKLGPKLAGDMLTTCPAFSGNRANLEKHILFSLAEKENFDHYWQYIHHPKSFFKDYIGNHVRRYCSENEGDKLKTSLKMGLDDLKHAIRTAIHESTAIAADKGSTASTWLDFFCDQLGKNLIFPRRDLTAIEHQEINDMAFLKEAMSADLDHAMKKVEEDSLSKPIEDMFVEIEKILTKQLCGCWKQCPMCKAICTNTISDHDGDHSVPFHRPQAVNGCTWHNTNNFVVDCCSTSVASDAYFIFENGQRYPYKNYRQAGGDYATWSITPDLSSHPHWKWFFCHFRKNLENHYQKKFTNKGTIPSAWLNIRKQDVLNYLNIT